MQHCCKAMNADHRTVTIHIGPSLWYGLGKEATCTGTAGITDGGGEWAFSGTHPPFLLNVDQIREVPLISVVYLR